MSLLSKGGHLLEIVLITYIARNKSNKAVKDKKMRLNL